MPDLPIQDYTIISNGGNGDKWFHSLGWISYFFAQLEWASYAVIERLGDPSTKIASMKKPYAGRTRLAADLVSSNLSATDPALASEWALFWGRAIGAAPMRNQILHNPITVQLHGMSDVGADAGVKLMQEADAPLIKLGDVQAFADKLRALNQLMIDLFNRTSFA